MNVQKIQAALYWLGKQASVEQFVTTKLDRSRGIYNEHETTVSLQAGIDGQYSGSVQHWLINAHNGNREPEGKELCTVKRGVLIEVMMEEYREAMWALGKKLETAREKAKMVAYEQLVQ